MTVLAATAATPHVRQYCEKKEEMLEDNKNNSIGHTGNRKDVAAVAAVCENIMTLKKPLNI